MFGRRKAEKVDVTHVGAVLMTMGQAVFAAAEHSTQPEVSWRQLTNLLYGVMHRRGWFPDSTDLDIRFTCELIQDQTRNPYGDMELGSTWEIHGTVPLDRDRLNAVSGVLLDLASLPQSVVIPSFMNELAPVMGKANKDVLSFAQSLPLVHAALTMGTVFGDTATVPDREKQSRRELASNLEAEFIAGWAASEIWAVALGRDIGDPHSQAYAPWW